MPGSSTLTSPLAREPVLEADPRVGTVLADRYRIDVLLGEGGMGRVYGAEHVLMRKRLAVKVLHRELTTVPEVVQRFEREAMAAANIDHPNVAAATDFGKLPDGAVFLVLEYVQGKNLRDEIAAGPLTVERALHIGRQIASALASAHALNIVHRDLKPENVMLVEKPGDPDFVKVLDFGIAKVPIGEVSSSQRPVGPITKVGMVFGTPEYMAPEQALGQAVDGRADLYALGVIIYEMVSGLRPFTSKSQVGILGQQLSKNPPTFAERCPGLIVPVQAEQVVMRLLAKDAADRYQTASEVVDALDALLGAPLTRGGRRVTQLSGSPNSVRGSDPNLGRAKLLSQPEFSPQIHGYSPLVQEPLGPPSARQPSEAGIPISMPSQPDASFGPDSLEGFVSKSRLPRAVEHALDYIDERRARWPSSVRRTLQDVPSAAFLAAAALFSIALVVALGVALASLARGKQSSLASSSAVPAVSALRAAEPKAQTQSADQELEQARQQGAGALEQLAVRYPHDVRVLLGLVAAYDAKNDYAQAAGAIGRALAADPRAKEDAQVASTLFKAAQAKGSSDASFALLQEPMGSRGADIVYDLATTKGVRSSVKQRAEAWLRSREFDRASSAALNVAVALRFAGSCQQKHALLLRAKNVGDERSLPYLKELEQRAGCGRRHNDDCFPCLRKDERLNEAVTAIEARSKSG